MNYDCFLLIMESLSDLVDVRNASKAFNIVIPRTQPFIILAGKRRSQIGKLVVEIKMRAVDMHLNYIFNAGLQNNIFNILPQEQIALLIEQLTNE